jgi:hypothetical protein
LVLAAAAAQAQPSDTATQVAAQPAEPAPPPPPSTEQPTQTAQPPAEQPAPPEAPPAAEAPPAEAPPASAEGARTVEDRLADLEGKVEGISEPFSAVFTDVTAMKRLKFSGYLQGRYEWHDDANFGQVGRNASPDVAGSGNPTNRETSRFYVRRARLKTTYAGTLSEFVLQIDATGDGVALRDAEASFHLTNENPWIPSATPWELKLTMGQFKIPFGFEVLQSSGDREFMERTRVMGALYAGERDRGLRLQYSYDFFRLAAAVINGVPIGSNDPHGTFDQSSWKDVVGRVGADIEFLSLGFSGHVGRFLKLTRAPMPAVVAGYERYKRLRLGSDAQFFVDVPGLGGLQLRGELIWARDQQMDFGGVEPPATRCNDIKRLGWYGAVIQNVGDFFTLAVRYDQWDPITSVPDSCTDASKRMTVDTDRVDALSVALLGHISGNLKATLEYDHWFEDDTKQLDNDFVTVQLQAKF